MISYFPTVSSKGCVASNQNEITYLIVV